MTKEALELALEALEEAWYHVGTFQPTEKAIDLYNEARTVIKEALAQPEQEPVYTHPAKDREDIEINITWNENSMRDFGKDELNFARAILRKAQEK